MAPEGAFLGAECGEKSGGWLRVGDLVVPEVFSHLLANRPSRSNPCIEAVSLFLGCCALFLGEVWRLAMNKLEFSLEGGGGR